MINSVPSSSAAKSCQDQEIANVGSRAHLLSTFNHMKGGREGDEQGLHGRACGADGIMHIRSPATA